MDYTTSSGLQSKKPVPSEATLNIQKELPQSYGADTLVLMARDPWWGFGYWEITETTNLRARQQFLDELDYPKLILRLYEILQELTIHSDIPIHGLIGRWTLPLNAPGKSFFAEIGYLSNSGKFLSMVRSNTISLPPADFSEIIDSEWMTIDEEFSKIYRASMVHGAGPNSEIFSMISDEWKKRLIRQLKEAQSSELLSQR